jgi:hypothetical protein
VHKDCLLDKFFHVDDDGTYSSPLSTKNKRFAFVLSSLSFGRVIMATGSIVIYILMMIFLAWSLKNFINWNQIWSLKKIIQLKYGVVF